MIHVRCEPFRQHIPSYLHSHGQFTLSVLNPVRLASVSRRPPCPIATTAAPDTERLPIVAAKEWLIISRDHNIREDIAERRAVRESGAKMAALAGNDARTKWANLSWSCGAGRESRQWPSSPGRSSTWPAIFNPHAASTTEDERSHCSVERDERRIEPRLQQ